MGTEKKSLGKLKNGSDVFAGDFVIGSDVPNIWKVLGPSKEIPGRLRAKAIVICPGSADFSQFFVSDCLRPGLFHLYERPTLEGTADIPPLGLSPVVTESCQCQGLFMNGHNHSCHMYRAPAPTINVWGIPRPIDNNRLIESIKNSDDTSLKLNLPFPRVDSFF